RRTDGGEVLERTRHQLQVQRSDAGSLSRIWIPGSRRSGEYVPGLSRLRKGIHRSARRGCFTFPESGVAEFRSMAGEKQKQACDRSRRIGRLTNKKGPDGKRGVRPLVSRPALFLFQAK